MLEFVVEGVLEEVVEHPVCLVCRGSVELGDALHHGFLFGEGV